MLTQIDEPQRFGVAEFDRSSKIKRLMEKPEVLLFPISDRK
jgi:dTDP-glucose pyrophosphorylase